MTKLYAATDIFDEIMHHGVFPDRDQIRALMKYLKSLGVSRLEWIVDDVWTLYESYPRGFDLLGEAVLAAHREGIELHAVYKPFEGVLHAYFLPHCAPRPDNVPMWDDERGLLPVVRPFVAEHPEMCLQLRAGFEDAGQPVETIRLLRDGPRPTNLSAAQISVWVGRGNGRFERYGGRFEVAEQTAKRGAAGEQTEHRVISLSGLDIGPETPYVEVRVEGGNSADPFVCREAGGIELVSADGQAIPCSPAMPKGSGARWLWLAKPVMRDLVRWGRTPAAQQFLDDEQLLDELAADTRLYGCASGTGIELAPNGCIAAVRGRPKYMPGVLNPVYPEARAHWLERLRFCLDRGVDGVNLRHSYHLRQPDIRDYGFNPPVLHACGGTVDWESAARVICQGYTTFLREARELVHQAGKTMGLHLFPDFLCPLSEREEPSNLLASIGQDWQTWVREIADYVEFRGLVGDDEEAMDRIVGRFASECRQHNLPFIYQSFRRLVVEIRLNDMRLTPEIEGKLRREMELVQARPDLNAYLLYETANFSAPAPDGSFSGSADLARLVASQEFES